MQENSNIISTNWSKGK